MKQMIRGPLHKSAAAALLVFLTASPLMASTSSQSRAQAQPKAQKRIVRKITRRTVTKTKKSDEGFKYSSTETADDSQAKPKADASETTSSAQLKSARLSNRLKLKSERSGTSTILPTEGAPRVRRAVKAKVDDRVGIQAPTFGDYTLSLVAKNTMTMGRKQDLEEIGGLNFALRNEFILGVKHKSGWGLGVADDIRQTNSNADTKDFRGRITDASVFLYHPALYKSESVSIGGQLRAFLPTSERSQGNNFRQVRYQSFADFTMPAKWGLSNMFMPIWFHSDDIGTKPDNSRFYIYDCLELTHQTAKTVRFGIGHQTQIETHVTNPTGTTMEIYPFVDIEWIPNVLIEPKVYLPVFVNNLVDGAPAAVAMSQLQAELYVKIGF